MQRIEFELEREYVELNQLLKLAGLVDSGGAGKQLVAGGAVRVDGVAESRKTAKIRSGQTVEVVDARGAAVAIHVRVPSGASSGDEDPAGAGL